MSNIRNVPHAEIQVKWLEDSSLIAELYSRGDARWKPVGGPSWYSEYQYRLIKKAPAVKKYHVVYLNPNNDSWTVTYNAAYTSVEDFYAANESLRGTKAEIIQASMVQSDESVEVVFTSPAIDSE